MESHRCKLCSRLFTNGRALGGHMKAHLTAAAAAAAAPPLPPPKPPSSSSSDDLDSEEIPTLYELRENPKKNFRFSDPVFHIVLQDRESETDSKNPTRKRSKRCRKPPQTQEPTSSISDTSPEEDLAMCLMMLSRDRRIQNQNQMRKQKSFEEIRVRKPIRRKKKCEKCCKQFRSYRALFSHERICELKTELEEEDDEEEEESFRNGGNRRIFKCPFCLKLFGSGQALGGHKRSHLLSSGNGSVSLKVEISLIDLNLPAPLEEDDYSVVSDA